jgi:hypothetical protein
VFYCNSTINSAFEAVLGETEAQAEVHTFFIKYVDSQIVQNIKSLIDDMEKNRKRVRVAQLVDAGTSTSRHKLQTPNA